MLKRYKFFKMLQSIFIIVAVIFVILFMSAKSTTSIFAIICVYSASIMFLLTVCNYIVLCALKRKLESYKFEQEIAQLESQDKK